jgi:hypothetical protein
MSYLRNIKVMGLALVAMLLFSGIAAASASARQPHTEGFPVNLTGTSGAGKLETIKDEKGLVRTFSCTGDTTSAEINSETSLKGVQFIFTGCTATGPFGENAPCKSAGAGENEIRAEPLKGELIYLVANSSRAGMDFKPEAGETFASFTCVGLFGITEHLTVTGSVVGELTPVNVLSNKFELILKQTKGRQEPEEYLDPVPCKGVKDVLETTGSNFESFGPLQSGLEATETVTTSKNLKVVSSKCE